MPGSSPVDPDGGRPSRDPVVERLVQTVLRVLPLVAIAGLPLLALVLTRSGIADPDTFWHLRAGSELLSDGKVVRPETGSSFTTGPWVLHEWAPEVLLALGYRVGALAGVVWVWALGLVGLAVTVVAVCSRRAGPLPTALAALLAFLGSGGGLGPRPQLVSFVLVTVTVGAWLATATDRRARWWLVPLGWVWACSHGMWFLGPGIGVVVVLAMLVDARRTGPPLPLRTAGRLVAVPVLTGLVALVTPAGPRLVLAPLEVAGYTRFVSEWDPSRLGSPSYTATLGVLAVLAAMGMARRESLPATRIALWLVALLFTVLYARTVAVGALIAAPLLAETLESVLPARRRLARRTIVTTAVGAAVLTLGVSALTAPNRTSGAVPAALSSDLDTLPVGTVVYDDYGYGGWLFWAHPDLRPVIDGRTELFTVDDVEHYHDAYAALPGWQATVAASGATYALLPTDNALGDGLVHQLGWRVVAGDDTARLLAAPPPPPPPAAEPDG